METVLTETVLKEIRLKNWKSFADATLYIDPFTVLIGTNASGKSNILDALVFLQRVADGLDVQTALGGNEVLPGLRGGMSGAFYQGSDELKVFVKLDTFLLLEKQKLEVELTDIAIVYIENSLLNIQIKYVTEPSDSILKEMLSFKSFNEFEDEVNNFLKGKDFFVLEVNPNKVRNYSRRSQNLLPDASNLAGFLIGQSEKENIEHILTDYLSQLPEKDIKRVWAEPVGRLGNDAMLYCEEEWIDGQTQIIDAHSMSDGTLRFLAILTALLTRPEGSLLAIEEVDNGLHPSRMHLLVQAIRDIGSRRKLDVLVTTHNPALLDNLPPEMMPFVQVVHRDPKTGASTITPLDDIEQLPKLLAAGSLGKITTRGELEQSLHAQEQDNG